MHSNSNLLKISLFIIIPAFIYSSCSEKKSNLQQDSLSYANMDTTVNPAKDFYHYADGGWLKNNPVPEEESSWGAFSEVNKMRYKILREILEDAEADTKAADGSNRKKVGDFYYSGMDSTDLNKQGIKPLAGELKKIDDVKDVNSLMDEIAHLQVIGVGPLYGISVDQ